MSLSQLRQRLKRRHESELGTSGEHARGRPQEAVRDVRPKADSHFREKTRTDQKGAPRSDYMPLKPALV